MQAIIYICTCNSQANLEINFMGTKENALFFEPYNLNGLQVSNRIVMAPMTRSRADTLHIQLLSLQRSIIVNVLQPDLLLPEELL